MLAWANQGTYGEGSRSTGMIHWKIGMARIGATRGMKIVQGWRKRLDVLTMLGSS
jgi:hypothetical protein